MKLKDKVALVTGSGRCLGRGIAKALAAEGARVVLNGLCSTDLVDGVTEIRAAGGDVMTAVADVSDSEQVDRMMRSILDRFGTLDILVNNAAITPSNDRARAARAAFLELMTSPVAKRSLKVTSHVPDQEWEEVIRANLTGVFHCTRAALRIMEPRRYGKIISIASLAGVSGLCFHSPHYAAAQAGVVGFTRSVALEVIGAGVNVNAIACGGILTEGWELGLKAMGPQSQARQLQLIPAGRMGSIDEYAQVVAFLASDAASYIVGQTINVNGGVVTN